MTTIAIAGNPNSGKSSIFNLLTDGKQKVGNWPGVTVDKKIGKVKFSGTEATLVDLPGIYALSAWSEDERIARDYLVSCEADFLINVVDSTNLERNLFLTFLLKDMGIPMLVVLNMIDVAEKQCIKINTEEIEKELGVPVITTSAKRNADKGKILESVAKAMENHPNKSEFKLPPENLSEFETLAENVYKQIESTLAKTVKKGIYVYAASDKVDKIVTNKYAGFLIFLLAMYLLFWLTIHVGGVFIDFFDIAFGAIFVDGVKYVLTSINAPEAIVSILADGVGAGIQTLSTFFPITFSLFFFIGLLESSGYMARAAFVMDRVMRTMGLPGKAFIPMLVGFGCSVPAIMATRNLENKRDRVLSVFMVPFMSCGARLPVYILFTAAFFPNNAQNVIFTLYAIGILLAVATGLLLKGTVYKGNLAPFIMELPQYHAPQIKAAAMNAMFRLKAFIKKSGRILIPIIAILGTLNSVGVLPAVGKSIAPVFYPIGISENNWQASVGVFSGLFAKESIMGAMNSLYSQDVEKEEDKEFSLTEKLGEAFVSIVENVKALGKKIKDPIGFGSFEENAYLFDNMRKAFNNSSAAAFAFLIFVLLYVPCLSAVAVAAREVGFVLVFLQSLYSTVLGWCLAVIFYQLAEGHSIPSIVAAAIIFPSTVLGIVFCARKSGKFAPPILEEV